MTASSTRPSRSSKAKITHVLKETFGYDTFRPGQLEAIQSLIKGRDTLAVLPTGAGKSVIYQIAAMLTNGVTLVVSPLIALQQDQVNSIAERQMGGAVALNSSLNDREREATLADIRTDAVRFVFLAPEQFANSDTVSAIAETDIALVVIDEAHCISEWGHDFRSDYLHLGAVIERLGHPTICALTATAAPPVRHEIVERLGMNDPAVIVSGFNRPNICLSVERVDSDQEKREAILNRIDELPSPGIVYTATRAHAEELATALQERAVNAVAYHAGLKAQERSSIQDLYMDDGHDVIVATIAFGMGIDKHNVRFVIHASVSESIDAYYQEIGRAGRDGEPAEAILLYDPRDLNLRRFQSGAGELPEGEVVSVLKALHHHRGPDDLASIREEVELGDSRMMRIISRLEDVGSVEIEPDGTIETLHRRRDISNDARAAVVTQRQHQQFARSRLEMMRRYADQTFCRRADLITYFGETFVPPCGNCDNCLAGHGVPEQEGVQPFALNSTVRHRQWGGGTVLRYEDDTVLVLFESVGYRTLLIGLATSEGLLTSA